MRQSFTAVVALALLCAFVAATLLHALGVL